MLHNPVLRYIDEVARQRSIRKAARVLNISSTAVNRQILKLEGELGTKIFNRIPDGVELTPAGEVIISHARRTLFDFQKARGEVSDITGLRIGHVRVSTLDSLTFEFIPQLLNEFSKAHPGVTFTINTTTPEEIPEAVASGGSDIGLGFTNFHHPDARVILETPTPFGAIVTPNHPLASRHFVTMPECTQFPIARTHDSSGKALFLEDEARSLGLPNTAVFYSNSLVMIKHAILSGFGIGIFTKMGFTKEIKSGDLKFIPLSESNLTHYKLGAFISSTKNMSTPANLLTQAIKKQLRNSDYSI